MPVILAPIHTRLLKNWTMLAHSSVQVNHTGSTAEQVLATVNVAAGAMGPNGILRITTLWSNNNNANAKTLRIRLGGAAGTQFLTVNQTTNIAFQAMVFIRNRNAANSQISVGPALSGFGPSAALVTAAIDTSAAQDILFSGQLGVGTDNVAIESYLVELFYGA